MLGAKPRYFNDRVHSANHMPGSFARLEYFQTLANQYFSAADRNVLLHMMQHPDDGAPANFFDLWKPVPEKPSTPKACFATIMGVIKAPGKRIEKVDDIVFLVHKFIYAQRFNDKQPVWYVNPYQVITWNEVERPQKPWEVLNWDKVEELTDGFFS